MPNESKVETVRELKQDLQSANALLLTDYRGLTVSEMTELRRKLHEAGANFKVVKNSLFKLAAEDLKDLDIDAILVGPTAIAFVQSDPVASARTIVEFIRVHKELSVKGGIVEGSLLDADQIQALSKIPPKEVLVAQMIGGIQAPIYGFVGTLQGLLSNLVYTLQAVSDKKAA